MKLFPVRYWWEHRGQELTATTVASGHTPEEALANFKRENPHLSRAVIINP